MKKYIETSQLICTVNQLTSFYMRETLTSNGLNKSGVVGAILTDLLKAFDCLPHYLTHEMQKLLSHRNQ